MAKCEERKSLPAVSIFLPENYNFTKQESMEQPAEWTTELNRSCQVPLQGNRSAQNGPIEEVVSCNSLFL